GARGARPPAGGGGGRLWPSFRLTTTRTRAPAWRALHAARRAASPPPTTRTSVASVVAAVERRVTRAGPRADRSAAHHVEAPRMIREHLAPGRGHQHGLAVTEAVLPRHPQG